MKYRLIELTGERAETISGVTTAVSNWIDVASAGGDSYSCQAIVDVNTPSAKTFDSGVASSLLNQGITYTADVRGVDGDDITIEIIDPGGTEALDISVTGTNIVISLATTADVVTTDADALVAAINLDAPASALITASGSGAVPLVALAETPLAGGVDSEVNATDDELTIPAHGLPVGLKGQLTTTGTLPTGYSLATDYFVIVIDENTIQLAANLADAQAGTPVTISSQGASASVNTFTPTAIAGGSIKLQQSNDGVNASDLGSATNVTADANIFLEKDRPTCKYIRVYQTLTAGSFSTELNILVKGDKDL
jgi:hypothetical protein